ncbi:MAG: MBG domain-containing protein [Planctomycetota bacterium]
MKTHPQPTRRNTLFLIALLGLFALVVAISSRKVPVNAPVSTEAPSASVRVEVPTTTPPLTTHVPAVSKADVPPSSARTTTVADVPFVQFSRWADTYIASSESERPALIERGVILAEARRVAMAELIRANPSDAIVRALPDTVAAELPEPVRKRTEKWVSGKGQLELLGALPAPDRPMNSGTRFESIQRIVTVNGASYNAYTSGQRLDLSRPTPIRVQGLVLDGIMALHNSPIRLLSPGEEIRLGLPLAPNGDRCLVSGLKTRNYAVDIGGQVQYICTHSHLTDLEQQLLLSEQADANTAAVAASINNKTANSTTTSNTLIDIVAKFSDDVSYPIDLATATTNMNNISQYFREASYGKTDLVVTICQVTLPNTKAYYQGLASNQFNTLLTDARTAAAALNAAYTYTNFNLDITTTTYIGGAYYTYAGIAYVGSPPNLARGVHLNGYYTLRTAGHELGHNYGLWHSNYWQTDSTSPIGRDTIGGGYVGDTVNAEWIEYGHLFSTMSAQGGATMESRQAHYTAHEKTVLNWITSSEIATLSSSATVRVYRHDHINATGIPRAVKINTVSSDYTGNNRKYWLSYRMAFNGTNNNEYLKNGLEIDWSKDSYGSDGDTLLDMTPASNNGPAGSSSGSDNNDKVDSALSIGKTYADTAAGIFITPIAKGGAAPNEYIDTVVNIGTFATNNPPVISSITIPASYPSDLPITLTCNATDPDGDTLTYHWSFGDSTFSTNGSATQTKAWATNSTFTVKCTVSDMKGGTATLTKSVPFTISTTAKPDLVIQSIKMFPLTPVSGDSVTFTLTVKNQGNASANSLFNVGFWPDLAAAPIVSNSPTQNTDIAASIMAGDTRVLTFTVPNVSAGTFNAWAFPDMAGGISNISESNETNNAGPGTGFAWTVLSTGGPSIIDITSTVSDNLYKAGQVIPITITFSHVVNVTGTPTLTLETGSTDAVVIYSSGSGTSVLTFNYTVAAGQTSMDLDYISTAALSLNGGTIKDSLANDAVITLPAPGSVGSLGANKNIVIDTVGPTVVNVSSTVADSSYKANQIIPITVTFNEVAIVTGTPTLTLETGSTKAVVNYSSGTGTTTLTFNYVVASGHISTDLNYTSTSALALNSGTIRDGAANSAILTLPALNATGSLASNKNIVIDTAAPTVTNITSPAVNGTYSAGQIIPVTVTFNETVTVVGTPQLTLETGATDAVVNYSSGSGTDTLTFNYTVTQGDSSSDLDYVISPPPAATSQIGINFSSGRTNETENVTGSAGVVPMSNWNNIAGLSGQNLALIDSTGAASAMTLSYSGSANSYSVYGSAKADQNAQLLNSYQDTSSNNPTVTVQLANIPYAKYRVYVYVNSDGAGRLGHVTLGGSSYYVNTFGNVTFPGYTQAAGTTPTAYNTSNYVMFDNQSSSNATITLTRDTSNIGLCGIEIVSISTVPSALALNGGSIRDVASNDATLTLPTPGASGSLSFNKNIALGSISITTLTIPDGAYIQNYSQQLAGSGGTPAYTWSLASGTLPTGLTLSPSGLVSGMPTAVGIYNFVIQLTDSINNTVQQPYTLIIAGSPTVTTSTNASATYSLSAQTIPVSATVSYTSPNPIGAINEGAVVFAIKSGNSTIGSSVSSPCINGSASATYSLPPGTPAGTYVISASYSGTNFAASTDASHTLVVNKAAATVGLSTLSAIYDGTPKGPTATTTPANLTVSMTFNSSPNQPVSAGSYPCVATIVDTNYQGSATSTFVINPAPLTVTADSGSKVYGTTNPAFTGAVVGVVNNDGITATFTSQATALTNAGAYAINSVEAIKPVISDPNQKIANYTVTLVNGPLTITKAPASISVVDSLQAYDGTGKTSNYTTNPGGLSAVLTYNTLSTPPINGGTYQVVATINDVNYAGSGTGTLIIDQTVILSSAAANPNPVGVSKSTTFSVTAQSTHGDTLSYAWSFGDGTQATGASATHSYSAPGTYMATVTIDNGLSPVVETVLVAVNPAFGEIGMGPDSDGDGFADSFEAAGGLDPNNYASTPTGNPVSAVSAVNLTVTKLQIKLNFAKPVGNDSIALTGVLPVSAGLAPSGTMVLIDVGGVLKKFILDAKGVAKVGKDSIKIAMKMKNGVAVASPAAKFTIVLGKGTFAAPLAAMSNLTNGAFKSAARPIKVSMSFNGNAFRKDQATLYTAITGKGGAAK